MEEKSNKKKKLLVVGIVVLVMFIFGVSYAMYMFLGTGILESVITTGKMRIIYTENDYINLENQFPMIDFAGINQTNANSTMDFTITSDTNAGQTINYVIALDNIEEGATLTQDKIKIYLLKEGDVAPAFIEGQGRLISSVEENNAGVFATSHVIHSDSFTGNGSHHYVLKAWIDGSYEQPTITDGDVISSQSETFTFKIKVVAVDQEMNAIVSNDILLYPCFQYTNEKIIYEVLDINACVDYLYTTLGHYNTSEEATNYCNGTGDTMGRTIVEDLNDGIIPAEPEEYLITNNIISRNEIVTNEATITNYYRGYEYEVLDINACADYFYTTLGRYDTLEEATNYCNGTGNNNGLTIIGDLNDGRISATREEYLITNSIISKNSLLNPNGDVCPTSVTIPNNINGLLVTSIGNDTFFNKGLTSLDLSEATNLKTIGFRAFSNNQFSGALTIPNNVESIGDFAFSDNQFSGTLTISNNVESIGISTFSYNQFSGTLTIPNSVVYIGISAFEDNQFSGTLTIPNSVESIGAYAFEDNQFSGALTIPNSVKSIGAYAFNGNQFSGTLTISNSVESIGNNAFSNNSNITAITIDNVYGTPSGSPWGSTARVTWLR